MKFDFRYYGSSAVDSTPYRSNMSFAPDTTRGEVYFSGEIGESLAFREAMGALHEVVVADLRWKPKDKTAYKRFAEERDARLWQDAAKMRGDVSKRIDELQNELSQLQRTSWMRMAPYRIAEQRYFNYLYRKDRDTWFVLDPVITVHPDEVFFECFSEDESSYGRVGVRHEAFRSVGELACGTTNVDYSAALYDEFQKIRTYKKTRLDVDPSGFTVETENEEAFKEVKIDLPDSWVRGFLQVSSAMTLPTVSFELHPMDVHNICFVLRRRREINGPRSLRWMLEPNRPVRVVVDPWGLSIPCPRSIYEGDTAHEIRTWGRRRLHVLERLVPIAERFVVHLLGTGMPHFIVAEAGHLTFTLGLSGWTANDWSRAGNFDLMAPRADVDTFTSRRVFDALGERWVASPDELATALSLDRATVLGALGVYTQAGRVIYDLERHVYRKRELARDPLPIDSLRFANEREESAWRFIADGLVRVTNVATADDRVTLEGRIKTRRSTFEPRLTMDADQRLVVAFCTCNFYQQNILRKGPCEHLLALRSMHSSN